MIAPPKSARIGSNTDLRFNSEKITLGENIVFDDDVRIVVPERGRLIIGNNVKIGKGTVINCGGTVIIGNDVAFYGYCYVQSSRWKWDGDEKRHAYHEITIGDRVTFAPNSVIAGDVTIDAGYCSQPGEVVGQW